MVFFDFLARQVGVRGLSLFQLRLTINSKRCCTANLSLGGTNFDARRSSKIHALYVVYIGRLKLHPSEGTFTGRQRRRLGEHGNNLSGQSRASLEYSGGERTRRDVSMSGDRDRRAAPASGSGSQRRFGSVAEINLACYRGRNPKVDHQRGRAGGWRGLENDRGIGLVGFLCN